MGGACGKGSVPVPVPETDTEEEAAKRRALQGTRGRRTSVSAEATGDVVATYVQKNFEKTDEQREAIRVAVADNFLFFGLDATQLEQITMAMFEKKVKDGEEVITQGDWGDNFYIISEGEFDVFVKGHAEGKRVHHYTAGMSFGELALMYNSPRAATVCATTDASLWCVDRVTFRHIIIDSQKKRRAELEPFVNSVSILSVLTDGEREQLCDALGTAFFKAGECIVNESDPPAEMMRMYIIRAGSCTVSAARAPQLATLGERDFFGEKALIEDCARSATVSAAVDTELLYLDKPTFNRLLPDIVPTLKALMAKYK